MHLCHGVSTWLTWLSKLRYSGALCYQQHKKPAVCIMQERKPSPNGAGKHYYLNCHTSSNTTENDTPAVLFFPESEFHKPSVYSSVSTLVDSSSSEPLSDSNKGKEREAHLLAGLVRFPWCRASRYSGRIALWTSKGENQLSSEAGALKMALKSWADAKEAAVARALHWLEEKEQGPGAGPSTH